MRVLLDARLFHASGGVEQAAIGVAAGLREAAPTAKRSYLIYQSERDWLEPYLGPTDTIIHEQTPWTRNVDQPLTNVLLRVPLLKAGARALRSVSPLPGLDPTIETEKPDVVHFLTQIGHETHAPSIYSPHDLQHRHLPEMFGLSDRVWRERTYRKWCERAAAVIVMTEWGRADIINAYGVEPSKVRVIPWASLLQLYGPASSIEDVRRRYALPEAFLLYPSRYYRHKNHDRLLAAMGRLRKQGVSVPVVFTGGGLSDPPFMRVVAQEGVSDIAHVLGFVPAADLRALFAMSRGLIFPSLFEGWGLPITEAFEAGVPVAASDVAAIPEVAGDAALLFDPLRVDDIASAIERLWNDDVLRGALAARGRIRASALSWLATGRALDDLYNQVAEARA